MTFPLVDAKPSSELMLCLSYSYCFKNTSAWRTRGSGWKIRVIKYALRGWVFSISRGKFAPKEQTEQSYTTMKEYVFIVEMTLIFYGLCHYHARNCGADRLLNTRLWHRMCLCDGLTITLFIKSIIYLCPVPLYINVHDMYKYVAFQ